MITEDYVSFETAKLLKDKGFKEPTDDFYDNKGKTLNEAAYGGFPNLGKINWNRDPFVSQGFLRFVTFSKPTQSVTIKWLKKNYHLHIEVTPLKSYSKYNNVLVSSNKVIYIAKILRIDKWNEDLAEFETLTIPFTNKSESKVIDNTIKYCLENLI